MTAKLLPLIPPHQIYVEPFGGGASLLFAKNPSNVEVYNDLDSGLVNFFRVLRDAEKFKKFHHLASLTPYSREEFCFCRDTWKECDDDVERAYRWFVVARLSFSGSFGAGWSFAITSGKRGMAETTSTWLHTIEHLPEIHNRLMRVQIEHRDYKDIFQIYDTPKTLFYCDPPYVPFTRRNGKYNHEMEVKDHEELVAILLKLKGMVLLSGYQDPVYNPLELSGWRRYDYKTACHAAAKTRLTGILGKGAGKKMQARTESVWVSPNCKKEMTLFDEVVKDE